jgi:threonine synthase
LISPWFSHLECSRCEARFEPGSLLSVCTACGETLLPRYKLGELAESWSRDSLAGRPMDLWRYREVLPTSVDPVSLGEGGTPLIAADRLGAALGLPQLWIKDEALNPTGSFKARGMSTAVSMARDLGVTQLALPSAGNAGGAAAAYGARAGMSVDLFLPAWTPEPFVFEAKAYGARVHLVEGDISVCGARVREGAADHGWFDLSTLKEPYRLEGKKTMGYELAEQFAWDLPDAILYPTGGGTGLIGMWKAFAELEELGWIPRGQRPRMYVVQAAGCAPMVRAYEEGTERAEPWQDPETYASGLRVPVGIGDHLILRAVRESGGSAIAVSESGIARAQLRLMRQEGVFAAPEGGAVAAALDKLVERGEILSTDRVVLFNTGSGLKYPEIPGMGG